MDEVGSAVLIVIRNNDAASGERLLLLGVAELAHGDRSGNTHDARGDKRLCVDTHADVRNEHRTSNRGETRAHDLVDFGHGEVSNERLDKHSRFTLSDEGRGSGDDGLGARDAHGPEEEGRELADEPLDEADVVQELHERDEEDDGGQDRDQEPVDRFRNGIRGQESSTLVGKAKQLTSEGGDEVEDVTVQRLDLHAWGGENGESLLSGRGAQDEKGNDELHQHADNDRVPDNALPVSRSGPQSEDEDNQTEDADCTVGPGIVAALGAGKSANEEDSDDQQGSSRGPQLLGDERSKADPRVVPHEVHGLGDNGNRDMEEDDPKRDAQIEQERNDPVLVMAVQDQACDPPSVVPVSAQSSVQRRVVSRLAAK